MVMIVSMRASDTVTDLAVHLTAVEKNRYSQISLHGCEIKSGRGRPGFEASARSVP